MNRPRITLVTMLGLLALLAWAPHAGAALIVEHVINVGLTTDVTQPGQDYNGTNWSATVSPLPYSGSVWNSTTVNNLGPSLGTSVSNLRYSDTGSSSYGFTFGPVNQSFGNNISPLLLLRGGAEETIGYPNDPITLTITGLPTAPQYSGQTFDLYISGILPQGALNLSGSRIALGAGTPQLEADTQHNTWVAGDNYVLFTDILNGNNSGSVTVTLSTVSGYNYTSLNGFQLAELAPVPEPSVAILLGVGATVLWRRRSRWKTVGASELQSV